MADGNQADFTLRLLDQVSAPARKAQQSIARTTNAMEDLRRASKLQDQFNRRELQQRLKAKRTTELLAQKRAGLVDRMAQRRDPGFQRQLLVQRMAERAAREQAKLQMGLGGFQGGLGDVGFAPSGAGAFQAAIAGTTAALLAAAAAVAFLAAKFVSATVAAINFGQRSRIALTSILRDGALAATQFDETRREAQRLGLDVMDTVDSFRGLANAGFDIATARDLVRMSADLQAVTGSAESAKFALRAITQIQMKGRLQAEEVTGQLAEHGVSADEVYRVLGKTLGKTRKEILAMQKAGEITADIAIPAILQAVRNQLGKQKSGEFAAGIAGGTLGGLGRQLVAMWDNALISLGQAMDGSASRLAGRIFGTLQKLATHPATKAIGDKLVAGFTAFERWTASNWPAIELRLTQGIDLLLDAVSVTAQFFERNWQTIKGAVEGGAILFVALGLGANEARKQFSALLKPIIMVADAIAFVVDMITNAHAKLAEFLNSAGQLAGKLGLSSISQALLASGADMQVRAEFNRTSAIEESKQRLRARENARSAAGQAGAAGASFKSFGDIRIGDINVHGVEHQGTPESAGEIMGARLRMQLISALEDA